MSRRPPARRLLLLAALLFLAAYALAGYTDIQRPAVSLSLIACFTGAWLSAWIGAARTLNREVLS